MDVVGGLLFLCFYVPRMKQQMLSTHTSSIIYFISFMITIPCVSVFVHIKTHIVRVRDNIVNYNRPDYIMRKTHKNRFIFHFLLAHIRSHDKNKLKQAAIILFE